MFMSPTNMWVENWNEIIYRTRDFVGKFIAIEVALPVAAESRKEKKCENQLFIVSSIRLKLLCYVCFCEIAVTIAHITCRRFFLGNYNSTSSDATKSSMQINFIPIGERFAYFYTGERCARGMARRRKTCWTLKHSFIWGTRNEKNVDKKRRRDESESGPDIQQRTCEHK